MTDIALLSRLSDWYRTAIKRPKMLKNTPSVRGVAPLRKRCCFFGEVGYINLYPSTFCYSLHATHTRTQAHTHTRTHTHKRTRTHTRNPLFKARSRRPRSQHFPVREKVYKFEGVLLPLPLALPLWLSTPHHHLPSAVPAAAAGMQAAVPSAASFLSTSTVFPFQLLMVCGWEVRVCNPRTFRKQTGNLAKSGEVNPESKVEIESGKHPHTRTNVASQKIN